MILIVLLLARLHVIAQAALGWAPLGGADDTVETLVVIDGHVWASGLFNRIGGIATQGIAYWNGSVWDDAGVYDTDGRAFAYAKYGGVVAAGTFTYVNEVSADRIAIFDPLERTWAPLPGGGLSGTVRALAVDNGRMILYAAGSFDTAGTLSVNRVASYSDSAWHALGSGLNNGVSGTVFALTFDPITDLLFLGGTFSTA